MYIYIYVKIIKIVLKHPDKEKIVRFSFNINTLIISKQFKNYYYLKYI